MAEIAWTVEAQRWLEDIFEYIATDNPQAAARTVQGILARFFAAYIRSKIDYFTFTRLARALEKFNIELLPNLRWFYTREEPTVETPEEIIHELSLAGLVTDGLEGSGTIGGSAGYRYSELGKAFLLIGFDVQPSAR